jgi:hypothetical protein
MVFYPRLNGYPKLRGLKRLKRNVEREVQMAKLDLNQDSWYSYWHHHLDWHGLGSNSGKWFAFFVNQFHLLHYKYFEQIKEQEFKAQLWLTFDPSDFGQSGIYIHSPNPNTDFPYVFKDTLITQDKVPKEFVNAKLHDQLQYSISKSDCLNIRFKVNI